MLKHCPALQKWLLNVALPDEYEVNPAHGYFVVCLFAVYLTEPVFAVKQTCSPLQADLLTWMTPRSVSSAALCCMLLSCSAHSSLAPTLAALSLQLVLHSSCCSNTQPNVLLPATASQLHACACQQHLSVLIYPLCCRSSGQTGME